MQDRGQIVDPMRALSGDRMRRGRIVRRVAGKVRIVRDAGRRGNVPALANHGMKSAAAVRHGELRVGSDRSVHGQKVGIARFGHVRVEKADRRFDAGSPRRRGRSGERVGPRDRAAIARSGHMLLARRVGIVPSGLVLKAGIVRIVRDPLVAGIVHFGRVQKVAEIARSTRVLKVGIVPIGHVPRGVVIVRIVRNRRAGIVRFGRGVGLRRVARVENVVRAGVRRLRGVRAKEEHRGENVRGPVGLATGRGRAPGDREGLERERRSLASRRLASRRLGRSSRRPQIVRRVSPVRRMRHEHGAACAHAPDCCDRWTGRSREEYGRLASGATFWLSQS